MRGIGFQPVRRIPHSTVEADRQDACPTSRTSFQDRPDQPDAGERQVIEGDVEEAHFVVDHPLQRDRRPAFDLGQQRSIGVSPM